MPCLPSLCLSVDRILQYQLWLSPGPSGFLPFLQQLATCRLGCKTVKTSTYTGIGRVWAASGRLICIHFLVDSERIPAHRWCWFYLLPSAGPDYCHCPLLSSCHWRFASAQNPVLRIWMDHPIRRWPDLSCIPVDSCKEWCPPLAL